MISHLTPCFIWWPLLGLNQRPSDYENHNSQSKNNNLDKNQSVTKPISTNKSQYS